jgi:cell division protein FtsL
MELVKEAVAVQTTSEEQKAKEHNALISERYRLLQNTIENQFATNVTNFASTATYERTQTHYAPVANNTPTLQQRPTVTEYVRTQATNSPLFTMEKFERLQTAKPVTQVEEQVVSAQATQESYSLSPFAKMLMAAFTVTVAAMMTMICINTSSIAKKSEILQNLETQKLELMETNEEIQRRIAQAQSDDVIRQYAESQGMVPRGE